MKTVKKKRVRKAVSIAGGAAANANFEQEMAVTPVSLTVGGAKDINYGSQPLRLMAFDAFSALIVIELVRWRKKDGTYGLIPLGIGRTAKVFLGAIVPRRVGASLKGDEARIQYIAVKCLLTDPDLEYRDQMRYRFDEERKKTRSRAGSGPTFVQFIGYGWFDLNKRVQQAKESQIDKKRPSDAEAIALKEAADRVSEDEVDQLGLRPWPAQILSYITSVNGGEALDGAFYAMELCQGSLLDVLEGASEWHELPFYSALKKEGRDLERQQAKHLADLKQFEKIFFTNGWKPESYSGYEILHAFSKEESAQGMRGRLVLELAKGIARLMSDLHRNTLATVSDDQEEFGLVPPGLQGGTTGSESLAHRDLKPGNILLWHAPGESGLKTMQFRLSDLGYLVGLGELINGATSQSLDHWRAYQVPGSPYYRAPEQMRQSIEVRLRVSESDPTLLEVFSSKADNIEPGDYPAHRRRIINRLR